MDGLLLQTCSAHGTRRVGVALGRLLSGGEVLALCGNLGAGKTTLVQGIAVGLGLDVRVTSPTFTLINEYGAPSNRCRLLHADTYRLAEPAAEAEMLGDLFDEEPTAVVAVEWAERVAALLPPDHLRVELSIDDATTRTLRLTATGVESAALLERLRARLAELPEEATERDSEFF